MNSVVIVSLYQGGMLESAFLCFMQKCAFPYTASQAMPGVSQRHKIYTLPVEDHQAKRGGNGQIIAAEYWLFSIQKRHFSALVNTTSS